MRVGGKETTPPAAASAGSGVADLPLLPLFNAVLLPGGVVRVTIPAGWRKSTALVKLLLQQPGGEVLVAAVPYLTADKRVTNLTAAPTAASSGGAGGEAQEADGDDHLDLERLHHTGTAARVLQMVRRTQSGGWTVTLEGRCRVRVRSVHLSSRPGQEHYEASVQQLDYFAGAGAAASSAAVSVAAAKQQEELTQRLLKGTRRLFVLIQGEGEGREAAARVARALAQQGPARMADVLGSLVARALPDRLALLGELDVTERMLLVVPLLGAMVEMAEKLAAGGAGGSALARGSRRGRLGGRALRLPPGFAGAEGEEAEGEEEDEEEESKRELVALMEKLRAAGPPPDVWRAAQREFKRLSRGSDQHPGYSMSLAYLETLADLPWSRHSGQLAQPAAAGAAAPAGPPQPADGDAHGHVDAAPTPQQLPLALRPGEAAGGAPPPRALPPTPQQLPLALPPAPAGPVAARHRRQLPLEEVRQRLDEAHYGLDKVKERIVQYVAVQRLRGWDARAPILCFIGPPGVGKTSLARSIAEVLGRPFQRISLGGVRDEAEIRGHRRTYIGAMPGRLIQAVRKAGVRDPLALLDEVDKMGRDAARGDPAAALLEVLDPEQNAAFVDTYLGLPFDLSACLFVATANRGADIPAPLLDRLEVVQLGGYTREEKVHIAERHLIPRLLAEHGLHQGQLVFPQDSVRGMIEGWTREAGVRSLARTLAAVCRHVAVQVVRLEEQRRGAGGGAPPGAAADPLGGEQGGAEVEDDEGLPLPEGPPLGHDDPAAEARAAEQAAAAKQARAAVAAAAAGAARRTPVARPLPPPRAAPRPAASWSTKGRGSGGGLQLKKPAPGGQRSLALWADLAPLAAHAGTSAMPEAAAGYPWSQLRPLAVPGASGSGSAADAAPQAAAAASGAQLECSCSPRKAGWFGWLRWPRQEAGEYASQQQQQQQQQQQAALEAAATGQCACAGACADHDCCCGVSATHGQQQQQPATPADWAAGIAPGDSSSWELGWRESAPDKGEQPRLCGPGSMQAPRPPAALAATWRPAAAAAAPGVPAPPGGALAALRVSDGVALPPLPPPSAHRQVVVDEELLVAVLGPRRFEGHSTAERVAAPGTAAGLVWTAVGGKVQYIECMCVGSAPAADGVSSRAGGQLTLTGQLGEVLEESARIALSWVRAHAPALGLPGDASCPSRKWDVHIHLPAGAVPKDGPSAGITLAVALVSLFTERCVRADAAMTGELTLRGLVLPVGGVKEKMLAAQAAGMARVLVPARNMPDIEADVPAEVRQGLEVVPCTRLEDVLRAAFDPPLELKQPPLLARL